MSASRDAAADLALLKTLVGQLSSPLTNDGVKAVQNSLDQLCGLISVVPSLKKSYRTAGGIPILATLLNCGGFPLFASQSCFCAMQRMIRTSFGRETHCSPSQKY